MLPNLLVIGAAKSGTSSLHYYLGLHPEISMSVEKEPTFFVHEMLRGQGPSFLPGTWGRGLAWYETLFPEAAPVRGESSTMYTNHPRFPGVPERIRSVIPEVKLIYLLRDPIERAVADYTHLAVSSVVKRSITEAFTPVATNAYVARSCYALQLERYLKFFPQERILLVDHGDLLRRRRETLDEIFTFLGVGRFDHPGFDDMKERHADKRNLTPLGRKVVAMRMPRMLRWFPPGAKARFQRVILQRLSVEPDRPSLPPGLHAAVGEQLHKDAERLRALTGRRFPEWSV